METVFVRSQSGVIFAMDIDPLDDDGQPTTQRRERFDEQIAKGELQYVAGCVKDEWERTNEKGEVIERGYTWRELVDDDAPKAKRGSKPKPADDTDEAAAEG